MSSKNRSASAAAVRTRRAYFDCRFGQLHVRTAFPATGGFDEGVTLICLHAEDGSSRMFEQILPEIAEDRSVYAPDLPGLGESDPVVDTGLEDAVHAVADLAADLRLRRIDVLGFRSGAAVALRLAIAKPELVRRLVLIGTPPMENLPLIQHECLVMRVKPVCDEGSQWTQGVLQKPTFVDMADCTVALFAAAPRALARQIGVFLKAQ